MADNVTAPATGAIFATDEIAGVQYPRTKVGWGIDGAYVDVSAVNPLPVTLGLTDAQLRAAAVPVSGPLTDAQLRATALPVSGPLTDAQIRATALPVSGPLTNTQLRAADVPVSAAALPLPAGAATEATLAALQTLVNTLAGTIYNHNAPFVDGSPGQLMLGKRRDSDTTLVADGDLNTFNLDEEGRLKVASKPASYAAITGNVTSATSTVFANTTRFSNLMIHCKGTFAGVNVTFEGSLDSTNGTDGTWFTVQAIRSNANTIETTTGVLGAAPAYAWELSVNALTYFRVRATAWTSGTQVWTFIPGTYATEPIPGAQISGTQPVSGSVTATGVAGAAAHDAVISGNPVRQAGRALTANYTSVATGDTADIITTLVGAQVVKPYAIPEAGWNANVSLTTATATALIAAGGAGLKRHITALQAINTGASAVDLIILDGATERWRMTLPINVPVSFTFPTELTTTAATALNGNLSAVGTVRVCAQGYTAP